MTLALDHGKLKQRERDVAKALVDFLKAEGWRVIRLQTGVFRGMSGGRPRWIGEKGMPDYICLSTFTMPHDAERFFFLETKSLKGFKRFTQTLWHEQAERDGFLVCTARSLDELKVWMAANRLRA